MAVFPLEGLKLLPRSCIPASLRSANMAAFPLEGLKHHCLVGNTPLGAEAKWPRSRLRA